MTILLGGILGDSAGPVSLTGDVVGSGTGTIVTRLSSTGVIPATYGAPDKIPVITVDSRGRITTVSSVNIAGGATGTAAGSPDPGILPYSGYSAVPGEWNSGTTMPTTTTRLNYEGALYTTSLTTSDVYIYDPVSPSLMMGSTVSPTSYASLTWNEATKATRIGSVGTGTITELVSGGTTHLTLGTAGVTVNTPLTLYGPLLSGGTAGVSGQFLVSNGVSSPPAWRTVPSVTSVALSGGTTGLSTSGGPITSAGTITLGGTLAVANGGTGATTASAARSALDAQQTLVSGTSIKTINGTSVLGSGDIVISTGSTGAVTSVDFATGTTGFLVTGGPITSAGTLTLSGTLAIAHGGTGATSAAAARTTLGAQAALVSGTNIKTINGTSILGSGDIVISAGSSGSVTSVALSGGTTGLTTTGGPVTSAGTITLGGTLAISNGGTGTTSAAAARAALGAQEVLTSGTNIKTINGASILGAGDIVISAGGTGLTAGSTTTGYINYSGTTATAGQWNANPSMPTGNTRLVYNGALVANSVSAANSIRVISSAWPTIQLQGSDTASPSDHALFNYDLSGKTAYIGGHGLGTQTVITAGGSGGVNPTIITATSTGVTLSSATPLKVTNSTQSSSTSTGAATVSGGMGIGGNIYVGGTGLISGNMTCGGNTIQATWRANFRGAADSDHTIIAYNAKSLGNTITSCVGSTGTRLAAWYYGDPGASSTMVGSVTTTGSSTSYNTTSDYRLKTDVVDLVDATSRLMNLKPRRFRWKGSIDGHTPVDGFIAHEVAEVVPEAVVGEKDAVTSSGEVQAQGMDSSKLVPLLTAALQEMNARVAQLEQIIAKMNSGI